MEILIYEWLGRVGTLSNIPKLSILNYHLILFFEDRLKLYTTNTELWRETEIIF